MNTTRPAQPVHALRGTEVPAVVAARLDTDLRAAPLALRHGHDLRLADPGLEQALTEAREQVLRSATAEGYAQGYAAGVRAARERAQAEADAARATEALAAQDRERRAATALDGLRRAADSMVARALPTVTDAEQVVLMCGLELAATLLGRELELSTDPGMDAVRRAMSAMPDAGPVVVRLHPEDLALLNGGTGTLPPAGRPVELVADASVERGGAIADCSDAHVDAQLGAALTRAAEALA